MPNFKSVHSLELVYNVVVIYSTHSFSYMSSYGYTSVSYTHLTLPTIYPV